MSLAGLPIPAAAERASVYRTISGLAAGRPERFAEQPRAKALSLCWEALDEILPDQGFPRGAVVELASPYGLGRATSIALASCAAVQAEAKRRVGNVGTSTEGAWCAWIESTPESPESSAVTLFAPAAARAGVDLGRLLVVRPAPDAVARIALRCAQSRVFSLMVIDIAGVPGRLAESRLDRWANAVRRLAIVVEGTETTIVLLTDALAPRSMPLPVALRLEIERSAPERLLVTVAKDRRGRVGLQKTLDLRASA